MKLESKDYPMAKLQSMDIDEIVKLAKSVTKLAGDQKKSTDDLKATAPTMGKILQRLEKTLGESKAAKTEPSNTSLADYFVRLAGGKIKPHWYQCKDAFGCYVDSGLIPEPEYDNCSANALEIAGATYGAVAKLPEYVNRPLNHPIFGKIAELLKSRPDGYTKSLRALLESVKPNKPMDAEEAKEKLAEIFGDGHIILTLYALGAELANTENAQTFKDAFFALEQVQTCMEANKKMDTVRAEILAKLNQADPANKPPVTETPGTEAPANTENVSA